MAERIAEFRDDFVLAEEIVDLTGGALDPFPDGAFAAHAAFSTTASLGGLGRPRANS